MVCKKLESELKSTKHRFEEKMTSGKYNVLLKWTIWMIYA